MRSQPTLLNSCAKAATAAEARFRIDFPEPKARDSLIIALDDRAARIVRWLADRPWRGGRFFTFESAGLRAADGTLVPLSAELDVADVVVVIATADASAAAAAIIGDACAARRIMSAGLVVTGAAAVGDAVCALRPHAMVLLILDDENDIPPILTALRV
ncbi:MAG: 3-methyl-2-oxobutanoate hydroxymethyltransferase [Actinophytocola sp.]|nr:3-methyl-2-oxobutanoate hydroxymethyltransferase [Actinophytocola sp.]